MSTEEPFFIWEGVYPSFDAAPGTTEAFRQARWVERSRERALSLRRLAAEGGEAPRTTAAPAYCLPVIAAVAQAERGRLRLLDFGGCVGFSFHAVVGALARPHDVEYHLVDNDAVCRVGREVFHDEARLRFHSTLPEGDFDLVHLGSSLQYVADWAGQIRQLAGKKPKYLVFDDVPAGAVPTFVALQNYYGSKIPHWFWNVTEFVETVTRVTGYRLFYRARYVGTYLGKVGPLPMENYPPSHRIDYPYNMAFVAGG